MMKAGVRSAGGVEFDSKEVDLIEKDNLWARRVMTLLNLVKAANAVTF